MESMQGTIISVMIAANERPQTIAHANAFQKFDISEPIRTPNVAGCTSMQIPNAMGSNPRTVVI